MLVDYFHKGSSGVLFTLIIKSYWWKISLRVFLYPSYTFVCVTFKGGSLVAFMFKANVLNILHFYLCLQSQDQLLKYFLAGQSTLLVLNFFKFLFLIFLKCDFFNFTFDFFFCSTFSQFPMLCSFQSITLQYPVSFFRLYLSMAAFIYFKWKITISNYNIWIYLQ